MLTFGHAFQAEHKRQLQDASTGQDFTYGRHDFMCLTYDYVAVCLMM